MNNAKKAIDMIVIVIAETASGSSGAQNCDEAINVEKRIVGYTSGGSLRNITDDDALHVYHVVEL